jgi:type III restriction enzyme
VEQILGRILRLPRATRKQHAELNCAYALAASQRFIEAATSLKDALIENGFQRMEAELYVAGEDAQATFFGAGTLFFEAEQVVTEKPDLTQLSAELRERVTFDQRTSTLTVTKPLTQQDKVALEQCFTTPEAKQAVEILYQASHGRAVKGEEAPATRGPFRVPMLAIRVDGQLELFEEGHFLDTAWKLSDCEASLSDSEFPSEYVSGATGEIDVSDEGKVEVHFVDQIHRQLRLLGIEPGWDVAGLTNWLDRQISHPDITLTESTLFIHWLLSNLIESRGLKVEQLAGQKFRLRNAIAEKIDQHRRAAAMKAYQRVLFSAEAGQIEVSSDICCVFSEDKYPANWYYEGAYQFRKHFFPPPRIGELKIEGEEHDCAVFLDQLDAVKYWIRNLERRADSSFWLQTPTDKFYPDFVALLNDGRYLVVEYKGEHLWSNDDSKEKRAVGELWADRSKGACLFVMPKGTNWQAIVEVVGN